VRAYSLRKVLLIKSDGFKKNGGDLKAASAIISKEFSLPDLNEYRQKLIDISSKPVG
jgi:hypothetical protein